MNHRSHDGAVAVSRGGARDGREPGRTWVRCAARVLRRSRQAWSSQAARPWIACRRCKTLLRRPDIVPLSIPFARFYSDGDSAPIEAFARELAERARRAEQLDPTPANKPNVYLAISGGGDDGALGPACSSAGPRAATGHRSASSPVPARARCRRRSLSSGPTTTAH